jgi:hypothetical protein
MVTPDMVVQAITEEMDGPHDWRVNCCARSAGRAFARLWGFDPAAGLTYGTEREARRFFNGLRGNIVHFAAERGLTPCLPVPGAIGKVSLPGHRWPWVVGICIEGRRWAAKGKDGFVIFESDADSWGPTWPR